MEFARLRVSQPLMKPVRDQLLAAKMRPPSPHTEYIDRPRLLSILDGAPRGTVTLVVAPPGYGKTTLLAQWAAQSKHPVAWLSLATGDNDVATFAAYVVGAIEGLGQRLIRLDVTDPRLRTATPFQLATLLLNGLVDTSDPFSLVIDDYHVIGDHQIHELVTDLIDNMPAHLRLIISSRDDPPFPVARLRVLGKLAVMGVDQLRFTAEEAATFFTRLGIDLQAAEVTTLHERTVGWIAGLKMAALSLADREVSDETFFMRMNTSSQLLQDFLLEEVLRRQPPDVQVFLLRTALFDRFSIDLYQALTGQPGAAVLEHIRRANLFIVPLDENATWFHYDHLFEEFLRTRAAIDLDTVERRDLFGKASSWFVQQGMVSEAISAAISGQDWNQAAAMMRPIVNVAMRSEDLERLVEWFRALPTALLDADRDLAVRYAWCLVRLGDLAGAEQEVARAERVAESQGDLWTLAGATFAGAQRARYADDPDTLIHKVEQGTALLDQLHDQTTDEDRPSAAPAGSRSPTTGELHVLTRVLRAAGLRLLGQVLGARRELDAARELARRADAPYQYQMATVELGKVLFEQGRLTEADEYLREALAAPTIFPSDRCLALLSLAQVALERDRLDDAHSYLRESGASLERSGVNVSWPRRHYLQAQVDWARGAVEAAIKHAQAAVTGDNERVARDAAALLADIDLAHQRLGAALRCAYDAGLAPDDPPEYARLREHLVYVRLLMVQGEAEDAVGLLDRLRAAAEADGRVADIITILVNLSLAYQQLFDLERAVATLDRALSLAEPGMYVRTFTREGLPLVRLLRLAQRRGAAGAIAAQIQRLLTAMGEAPEDVPKAFHKDLAEGVTPREMEVLRLIAVGLSNREIANELFISVSTVKRHVTNLCSKLSVSTRTAAVQKARRLGLLGRPPLPVDTDDDASPEPR